MIEYGNSPDIDESEVVLFGPGYGEAICVHLYDNNWLCVDSCIEPESKSPAALDYLNKIGVSPHQVKAIVASHWHDDHVRGISLLAQACPSAEFHLSAAFNDVESTAFLAAYSGAYAPGQTAAARELYSAIQGREIVHFNKLRSNLLELNRPDGKRVRITAMSPVDAAIAQSISRFASWNPAGGINESIKHVPELHPNIESVALHLDFSDFAVLLGSDLEHVGNLGWSAVVNDNWGRQRRPSDLYKVAHHGSVTGEHPGIWQVLLSNSTTSTLTPFVRGSVRLPTTDDQTRIKKNSLQTFISSRSSTAPTIPASQVKQMRRRGVTKLMRRYQRFGAIRLRRRSTENSWRIELFGAAEKI